MNEREKVIVFAYEELKKKIIDANIPLEEAASFCRMILDSMPKNKGYIINYFNGNYDKILEQVVEQNDFLKALKILDVFLLEQDSVSAVIINKTTDKIIVSLRNMPDEVWKVRVLTQLSEKVLNKVLIKLDNKELNSLLYICPQVVNSEMVEKVIKKTMDKKKGKKKLILRKKR